MNNRPAGRRRAPARHNRRVPLAAWRLAASEPAAVFRFVFGDAIESWGVPGVVFSDAPPCAMPDPAPRRTVKSGAA